MPQLKHEQSPDASGLHPSLVEVVVHKFANALGLEISALQSTGLEQDHEQVFQFVAHPVYERQSKSLLGAMKRLARYAHTLGQFAQNIFLRIAAQLPFRRQPSNPLDELVIKHRHTNFQRVQHAHPVDFGKNVGR